MEQAATETSGAGQDPQVGVQISDEFATQVTEYGDPNEMLYCRSKTSKTYLDYLKELQCKFLSAGIDSCIKENKENKEVSLWRK